MPERIIEFSVPPGAKAGRADKVFAAEFDDEPRFVSSAMVFSTLISLVTLTALITLLRWWV